jgi:hypothetical protein
MAAALPAPENEYVKLIEKMRDLKMKEEVADPNRVATDNEIDKVI